MIKALLLDEPGWAMELDIYLAKKEVPTTIEQFTAEEFEGMHKYNDRLYLDSHTEKDFDGKPPYLVYSLLSWRSDGMWNYTHIPTSYSFLAGFMIYLDLKEEQRQGRIARDAKQA